MISLLDSDCVEVCGRSVCFSALFLVSGAEQLEQAKAISIVMIVSFHRSIVILINIERGESPSLSSSILFVR